MLAFIPMSILVLVTCQYKSLSAKLKEQKRKTCFTFCFALLQNVLLILAFVIFVFRGMHISSELVCCSLKYPFYVTALTHLRTANVIKCSNIAAFCKKADSNPRFYL